MSKNRAKWIVIRDQAFERYCLTDSMAQKKRYKKLIDYINSVIMRIK